MLEQIQFCCVTWATDIKSCFESNNCERASAYQKVLARKEFKKKWGQNTKLSQAAEKGQFLETMKTIYLNKVV